jgi:hypothetical protein
MSNVSHLGGDIHQQVQILLPWYVNDTLDEIETETVEVHLAECAECRRDLEGEKKLGVESSLASMDVDQGWAAMRERIASTGLIPILPNSLRTNITPLRRKSILRRSIPLGWATAAQAAALVLIVGGVRMTRPPLEPVYHALGAAPVSAAGNVIVIFRPEATERELREALTGSRASLVGGPTDSNAYILHVDGATRASALTALRANSHVVLAEPIDGLDRP